MRVRLLSIMILLSVPLAFAQRVYVHGSQGYTYVSGVDRPLPKTDPAGHDETMELAKTFLERCPDLIPTTNKDNADFEVQLNWASRTRMMGVLTGGKILHKPDQILVTNKDGDIIYSGVARSVGGDVDAACKAIRKAYGASAMAQRRGDEAAKGQEQREKTPVKDQEQHAEKQPLMCPDGQGWYVDPTNGKTVCVWKH